MSFLLMCIRVGASRGRPCPLPVSIPQTVVVGNVSFYFFTNLWLLCIKLMALPSLRQIRALRGKTFILPTPGARRGDYGYSGSLPRWDYFTGIGLPSRAFGKRRADHGASRFRGLGSGKEQETRCEPPNRSGPEKPLYCICVLLLSRGARRGETFPHWPWANQLPRA
jgi:hypothetical protein